MDGIKEITPLKSAIKLGADSVDVIICSPEHTTSPFSSTPSVIDIAKRSLDLMSDEIVKDDISKALSYNELVKAGKSNKKLIDINVYRPNANLTEDSLDFSNESIKRMIEIGFSTAINKI